MNNKSSHKRGAWPQTRACEVSSKPSAPLCSAVKQRQTLKIQQLEAALVDAGLLTLTEQARALGLARSTTWTVLKGKHKSSGLSARTINRMLQSPQLPASVRAKIMEYIEEKTGGSYGHRKDRRQKFAAKLVVENIEHYSRAK